MSTTTREPMDDERAVLSRLPSADAVRDRLQELFAEARLLRGLLPLAERAERLRGRAAMQCDGRENVG